MEPVTSHDCYWGWIVATNVHDRPRGYEDHTTTDARKNPISRAPVERVDCQGDWNPIEIDRLSCEVLYMDGIVPVTSRHSLEGPSSTGTGASWSFSIALGVTRCGKLSTNMNSSVRVSRCDPSEGSSPERLVHMFDTQWRDPLEGTAHLTADEWVEGILDDRLHPGDSHGDYSMLRRLRCFES